jgi:RNA polymerase sigma factor (sigma-70 family)
MYLHPLIHTELIRQRERELSGPSNEVALQRQADHRSNKGQPFRRSRQAQTSPFDDLGPLVQAARAGDHGAWDLLVTRLTPVLRRVVRSYRLSDADVEDVIQTTWLAAFAHIERVRAPEAFGGWLTVTARRASLRVIQLSSREIVTDDEHLPQQATDSTPESALLDGEKHQAVRAAIDRLPDRQRRLVHTFVRHSGAPYADVATTLGMPIGSIGPTRERALARLRTDRQLIATI